MTVEFIPTPLMMQHITAGYSEINQQGRTALEIQEKSSGVLELIRFSMQRVSDALRTYGYRSKDYREVLVREEQYQAGLELLYKDLLQAFEATVENTTSKLKSFKDENGLW